MAASDRKAVHPMQTIATQQPSARRGGVAATLYFDLASPATYLLAERADRLLAGLQWRPACSLTLLGDGAERDLGAIAERAAQLQLPFVHPTRLRRRVRRTMRVATLAAERGTGAAFVLAATRLMFCGDHDIEDPEILAEAAAAAGIGRTEMLRATTDQRRDTLIVRAGRELLAAGAHQLPAVRVGEALFCGEHRLGYAVAAARELRAGRRRDAGPVATMTRPALRLL
jgi:2-hydroxychromene-2-carboxylate isomerase